MLLANLGSATGSPHNWCAVDSERTAVECFQPDWSLIMWVLVGVANFVRTFSKGPGAVYPRKGLSGTGLLGTVGRLSLKNSGSELTRRNTITVQVHVFNYNRYLRHWKRHAIHHEQLSRMRSARWHCKAISDSGLGDELLGYADLVPSRTFACYPVSVGIY